jgi:CRP/FNR family transcriptional regulator, cyclic AMP receptor protein
MERFGPAVVELPTPEEVRQALSEHAFVQGMDAKHLAMMAEVVTFQRFEAGKRIFQEGEPAERLYLVIRGSVDLEVFNLNQGTIPIQTVGDNEVLGWSWFVPPYRWRFDAKAVHATSALVFDTRVLLEMCEQDTQFGYDFMKRMATIVEQRLNAAKEHLLDMYAYRK